MFDLHKTCLVKFRPMSVDASFRNFLAGQIARHCKFWQLQFQIQCSSKTKPGEGVVSSLVTLRYPAKLLPFGNSSLVSEPIQIEALSISFVGQMLP